MGSFNVYETVKKQKEEAKKTNSYVGVLDQLRIENAQIKAPEMLEKYKTLMGSASSLLSDYNSRFFDKDGNFITSYRKDAEDSLNKYSSTKEKHESEITELRNFFNIYGKYLDSKTVSDITSSLDAYGEGLNNMFSTYQSDHEMMSKYKDEYDYNDYVMNNTSDLDDGLSYDRIIKRIKAYETNKARIAAIDKEIENMPDEEKWTEEYKAGGGGYLYKDLVETEAYQKLLDEKAKIQEYNTKYERGIYNTDKELSQYMGADDFAEDSNIRNGFKAPSLEDMYIYKSDVGSYSFGRDSEMRYNDESHATGIGTDSKGNEVSYNVDDLAIEDPLGTYLKALNSSGKAGVSGDYSVTEKENKIIYNYEQTMIKGENRSWGYLKDEEVGLYYYFLNNNMREQAFSYLDGMTTELNRRENNAQIDYLENEASTLELIFHNIVSVPANIFGGAAAFVEDTAVNLTGGEINPYGGFHTLQNYAQNTRNATANDLNEWTNNGEFLGMKLGDAYQAVMSGVDSVVGVATLGGGYSVLAGMGAATSKAKELYEQGASNEQIASASFLAGAAEMVFEKISIDHFLKNVVGAPTKKIRTIIKQAFIHGAIELSEESATEISNIITDSIVLGSRSDWGKLLTSYKEKGYSDSEAIINGILDMSERVWKSGASGFLSGFLTGGGFSTINYVQNKSAHNKSLIEVGGKVISNETIKDIADMAKSLPDSKANAKIKALANEVASVDVSTLSESQKAAFSKKVGQVYEAVQNAQMSEVSTSDRSSLNEIIKTKLNENGVTDESEIKKATEAIIKTVYENKQLSKSELNLMEKVGGKEIANYLINHKQEVADKVKATTNRGIAKILETETLATDKNLTEGKSVPKNENVSESKLDFNLDGQTINTKTGDTVNVTEIASIKDGKMTLKLDNGETVDADDVSFGTRDEAIVYSAVLDMGVNATVANSLVKNFKAGEGITAFQYAHGIKEAYKYGSYNISEAEMSTKGFAADLSEAQRKHAYNLGKLDAAAKTAKAQEKVQAKAEESGNGKGKGKVHFSGDVSKLDAVRQESLKRMNVLSEVLGVDFHVFESYVDKNGNRVYKDTDGTIKKAPNGYYKDGKIYIDLNAGSKGQGVMIYTVAHELTHFIKDWSPAKFKILADFLMEQYGEKGVSVNDLVEAQIKKAKKNGRTIDYATAYEEVVADSMETMLNDDKVIEKIQLLKAKDKGLVTKIKEFFKNILVNLNSLLKNYAPNSVEGKLVADMKDSIEGLQSLFAEALVDASNNYQAPGQQKNTTSEGDAKMQARELQRKDPTKLKEEELTSLLEFTKDKMLSDDTYIPVRINTPQILIAFAKEFGYTLENHPLAMQVYKVRQALSNEENWDGDYQDKPHDLSPEEVIGIIRAMNNPSHLVFQTENERFAEIVKFEKEGSKEKAYAIVDFSDVNKNPDLMNGYKGGKYNILVTVYPSEDSADLKKYLSNKNHKVMTGEQMKKKGISQGSYGGNTPSLLNDSPFFEDSIPQTSQKSQEKMSARENTIGERNLEDFAEAKDTEGKTLFQYRAMESDEDIYREMLKTANIMNDTEIDALFETIDKAMDIIKDNLEVLDYAWEADIDDRAFFPVKQNTDKLYQVSVDFSTLCRKRLLQQTIQAHLQEALNRPLTRNEGIAIRDALMTIQEEGKKIEIACALCYVESARMKSPAQIKRFVDDRETVIKNYFASKSVEVKAQLKEAEAKARKRLGADDTPLTKLPSKMQKEIRGAKKDVISSYVPSAKEQELIEIAKGMSVNDFVTPKGLESLIKKYPDLFDAYASFIVNATHSKGIENDTWWRAGDSKNIGDTLIANMNAENGLRSQSWSDFQVIHLLDYIAATIELSTRNAKMQAYTKVPDFVELMGNTGEMINLSLIPTRNFNGTLDFDGIEGMAFKESLRLRDKYHATAGTIAIGIDNVQIQMLLDSMDIDYVIPYHRSGMAKAVRKAMHIPTWTEYENYQSEKKLSRDDAKRQAKKYGVKLLAESDSNYQQNPNFSDWFDIKEARQIAKMENSNPSDKALHKKYGVMYGGYMAMQNAANNYLKLCAERGISPKFSHEKSDFTVEDNYWKLLIDRKMIDNVTGEVIEQQAVKPIFDQGEVLRILNDELERYPSVKADQDYATRKVTEKFLAGDIKGGMSAEAIAKAMKAPVDNIAKVNILATVEDAKLQDRDSEGNELSKEQQEFFANSKVRDAEGNLLVCYHGTDADFNTFDYNFISQDNKLGFGFYFMAGKKLQYSYKNPLKTYLNITNPLTDTSKKFSKEALSEFCENLGIKFDYDSADYDLDVYERLSYSYTGKTENFLKAVIDILGVDGIISENRSVAVAFSPNQIKLTTNTNPTADPDIRYQDRDAETAENIEKINQQLAKENVKLIEDVKYLKELVNLQSKETHGKMLKKSTVELVAKRLMAYSSAKGNVSELVGHLTDVYNYIIQGEDVSWEGIQEKSQAAVDWLMQNEYHKPVREEYANDVLKHLRTMRVSLDEKQKAEVAYKYGSFNDYRKKNMGRIVITNDGMSLDSAWQELAELYPMYFDKDVNSNDQPIMLMEIIDGLQNTYEADEYHYYSDAMVRQDLMTKVYEGYWDVSALHTVADSKAKEINLLKAKHNERMSALRESHKESDAKLRQEHRDKISQLRTEYREREEKKIQKVAEYYQKSRKEAVDRVKETREKREAITKLQRLVLDTAKWVSYPKKDDVKCPDIIRGPYAEFLSSIDLSSKRLLNGGEPTKNDLRVSSAMDSLAKAIEKKLGTQSPDTETETVLDTGYLDLPVHFVENLKELSESLKKRMETDGHIVNSMTSDEVKALTKFIKTLNHSIKEMSTLYSNMRFARVEELGGTSMTFLNELGEAKETNSIANFVTWDNALPYYTFKRFGIGGESVFEELMDSQDKLAHLADEIFKFKERTWSDKEANEWSKDTHTIDLPSGRKLTLTTADAMSIYCLSRREQGRQHLLGGGVRVLGIEKNGKKAKDSRSVLNEQDLLAIASSLSDRQIKVAEAIQEFMSTTCAEWGNEISMKRFLTREFTEKFYFPIESNDENLDTKDPKAQQSDLYRLLNISATKPLTKGANNEVIIRNVFDVFSNHSSDMAKLNSFGMALLDYMKWINYREKFTNDEGQITVKGVRKSMERAYGPEAKKYVVGLIKDINGRFNDNGDNKFLMKMIRGAKTAMVGANLRVAVLQVTAYPRAAMVVSPKNLALGLTKKPQIEKAKKYCGIALWKSFGFYDTNISKSVEEQIKGATNIRQKLIELSLKGAEWGDAITWGCLWNACEYEVAKTKQYKVGSEEFNQAVGKKLREVVYATQVVDSTLTRSQMMRSKSGLNQTASAFMSEPTVSANILMDAGCQFLLEKRRTGSAKVAWKKTSKYIGKAVAVYSVGQLFAALVEALMDAYRDDDDEEFGKKFGKAFKENAISDLNPLNKIPIVADISEILLSLTGIGFYSSNSLYSTAFDEFKTAFETWQKVINGEDGKTVYAGIYSTTKLMSYITGVSGSGLMREVVTLWNNTAGVYDPYLKIRTYETSSTDKGIAEYSFDKGDTESVKKAVSKMIEDKIESGKTEKEAKSAVRSSFTSTYKPEYMAAVEARDYDEMNRIRKFLYATGLYGTLSELDETLKKWRTGK